MISYIAVPTVVIFTNVRTGAKEEFYMLASSSDDALNVATPLATLDLEICTTAIRLVKTSNRVKR
jgi:hypothetical protein